MELRHLRYFQAVAETLSFSHAAARLRIAQSAVSRQVAALEQELGIKLFVRTTTRVRLTDAGRHLHKEVERLLAQLSIAITATQEIARGRGGELNLGSDWRILFHHISDAVVHYRSTHPHVTVNFIEIPGHAQIDALREGDIHIGFVPNSYVPPQPGWGSVFLFKTDVKVVVSARHPLARRGRAALRDLNRETWLRLDEKLHPGYRTIMLQLCRPALFTPKFGRVAGSIEGLLALVAMGDGICLMPTSLVSRPHPGLRFLESDCAPFELYAIWQKQNTSELIPSFLETLSETLASTQTGVSAP